MLIAKSFRNCEENERTKNETEMKRKHMPVKSNYSLNFLN